MKLGSLFDGIGGWPWAGVKHGINPVWSSEIEAFPIRVTKIRFPKMKHLGDITQINGAEIEPVDIITSGSPCQDLSVAGKRAGLEGKRSGLFMEGCRIIKEMRDATNGTYPRFAVWENVPGAFSSAEGEDFRAVLEEYCRIADPTVSLPRPSDNSWTMAGTIMGDGYSVAWRTLDAQYWGVPQRRKRIFLVADFGSRRAGEILFKPEGVSGYFAEGEGERERVAGDVEGGAGTADDECLTPWDVQSRRIFDENGKWPAIYGGEGGGHGYVAQAAGFKWGNSKDARSIGYEEELSPTLAGSNGGNQVPAVTILFEPRSQDGVLRVHGDICPTLNTAQGGQRQPCLCQPDVSPAVTAKWAKGTGGPSGDECQNLTVVSVDCRNLCENEELSGTLQHKNGGGYSLNYQNPVRQGYKVRRLTPTECERLQGLPDGWTDIPGATDTARYKALGNGMAQPCPDYVIERIMELMK